MNQEVDVGVVIPLGRRVAEIMRERGRAFTQSAMAKRIGYSGETLRLMLIGRREIYPFELEKIAKDLKLPVERITGEDVRGEREEQRALLARLKDSRRSVELALQINEIALGKTEKCRALLDLGRGLFLLRQYEKAHEVFMKAEDLANQIRERYGDTDLAYEVLINLVSSYTVRKDYLRVNEIIKEAEPIFQTNPQRCAALFYIRANTIQQVEDLHNARENSYRSLEYALLTDTKNIIGRAKINAAHYEYRLKQYQQAAKLQEESVTCFDEDTLEKFIASKELAKSLIQIGEAQRAETLIRSLLNELRTTHYTLLEEKDYAAVDGKLRILLSRVTHTVEHAQYVQSNDRYSDQLRYLACRFLMKYYEQLNEAEMFMRFFRLAEQFSCILPDVLDEEEL